MRAPWLWGWLLGAAAPALASVAVYLPPEELAATAPLVVEGTVLRTASGLDPERGTLDTYVTLRVEEVLRGPASLVELTLREHGGRFGDLVHEVDAVPVYEVGERVVVFLEPAGDGALRTAGQFFGKYARDGADASWLVRDLSGQGTIFRRPSPAETERVAAWELRALVASSHPPRGRPFRATPPELPRLLWDGPGTPLPVASPAAGAGGRLDADPGSAVAPRFVPLSAASPTRWAETDAGAAVVVNVEPAGNPLSSAAAAVEQIRRAAAAWSSVPESRVSLALGNTSDAFRSSNPLSPAEAMPPRNIVLFGDPYDDLSSPAGCSGTLAVGGYWRSSTLGPPINNVRFYPALRLYVIFNAGFACFLGSPDNLAEVATHELGHGLGFGHSTVADAVMRATAYGGRGPRLGADDQDAAHCHYPRTLTLTSPAGGETWTEGTVQAVTWTSPAEAGPDPGTVTLEWSADGGATWSPVATDEPDDGTFLWMVPASRGSDRRLRVRRQNRVSPTPAPYPSSCSQDASHDGFTIAAAAVAGEVAGLRAEREGGSVVLSWGPSCSGQATDYAVYEGSLPALRSGVADLVPVACSAGLDLTETLVPGSGDRYFLVAARTAEAEGSLSDARAQAAAACAPREASSCP